MYAKTSSRWTCIQKRRNTNHISFLASNSTTPSTLVSRRQKFWNSIQAFMPSDEFNAQYCLARFNKNWWEITDICYIISNIAWNQVLVSRQLGTAMKDVQLLAAYTGTTNIISDNKEQSVEVTSIGMIRQLRTISCILSRISSESREVASIATVLHSNPLVNIDWTYRLRYGVCGACCPSATANAAASPADSCCNCSSTCCDRVPSLDLEASRTNFDAIPQNHVEQFLHVINLYMNYVSAVSRDIENPNVSKEFVSVMHSGILTTCCNENVTPYFDMRRSVSSDTSEEKVDSQWLDENERLKRNYPEVYLDTLLVTSHTKNALRNTQTDLSSFQLNLHISPLILLKTDILVNEQQANHQQCNLLYCDDTTTNICSKNNLRVLSGTTPTEIDIVTEFGLKRPDSINCRNIFCQNTIYKYEVRDPGPESECGCETITYEKLRNLLVEHCKVENDLVYQFFSESDVDRLLFQPTRISSSPVKSVPCYLLNYQLSSELFTFATQMSGQNNICVKQTNYNNKYVLRQLCDTETTVFLRVSNHWTFGDCSSPESCVPTLVSSSPCPSNQPCLGVPGSCVSCTQFQPDLTESFIMLYNNDMLRRFLSSLYISHQCIDHTVNQYVFENYILIRLPDEYLKRLNTERIISKEVYELYGIPRKIFSLMPVPTLNICEVYGQRQFFRRQNSQCDAIPFFLPDIIKGMYLTLGSCTIKYTFNPKDAIIQNEDICKMKLVCSVESTQNVFEGGMWILDN